MPVKHSKKRKSSLKGKPRRRRARKGGLRGLSGSMQDDLFMLAAGIAGTVGTARGIELLHKQDFMKKGPSDPATTTTQGLSDLNFKRIGADAAIVAAGAAAVFMGNHPVVKVLGATVAGAGANHIIEDVQNADTLGDVSDYTSMYDNMHGTGGNFRMAGTKLKVS